jgi:2',3'-cyclic-nucleotide 2'-phosphodiesterase (5'-nucleotidase family)
MAMGAVGPQAYADGYGGYDGHDGTSHVTLVEMGDLHGTLVSHAAVLKHPDGTEYQVEESGGLARLKTLADDIKADNPGNTLVLSAGDITHGSAEGMMTVGDAMMVAINALGIDVFTPGNWDYGYGPAVFRGHFGQYGPFPPVPANIAVMSQQISCADVPEIKGLTDADSGYTCTERSANPSDAKTGLNTSVIKANFPVVSANTYNDAPVPNHNRMMDPYKILTLDNGVKVAVIGLSAAIVPQQADVFNIGLRFTQGVDELPGLLKEVKDQGADIVVVQSELGMTQNLYLAQHFKDIDVMYSAHTHEVTLGALLANGKRVTRTTPGQRLSYSERSQLNDGAAVVVETNRDMYVGRLDLTVSNGKVVDFRWEAIPTDDSIKEDPRMKKLVDWVEDPFLDGGKVAVQRHTFMPGGYCTKPNAVPDPTKGGAPSPPDNCGDTTQHGLQLTESLDTVVGHTDTLLLRHHVLEDTLNNFIADGIRSVTDTVVGTSGVNGWSGVDISMANGFRFGNAVLPGDDITLRDLYTWFPIAPAVNVADFSGQSIQKSLDTVLGAVFDRNPFMQRGGWYIGLANMTQTIDLKNRPFSSSGGRIVQTKIGNKPLNLGGRYVFASCYGMGNPLDDVCRTGGGANFEFFELADGDDYTSAINIVDPQSLTLPVIMGPVVHQLAPNNYLHPVHALRRYLDSIGGEVTEAQFGANHGRIVTVDSTKQPSDPAYVESLEDQAFQPDNTPDPTFVQPPFGAGPAFFSGVAGDR